MLIILLGDLLQQPEKKQIYTYEGKWPIYGINFSNKPEKNIRLAMGSFIEDTANKVEIIMLDEEKGKFIECTQFEHEYPPSKIMWIPDQVSRRQFLKDAVEKLA